MSESFQPKKSLFITVACPLFAPRSTSEMSDRTVETAFNKTCAILLIKPSTTFTNNAKVNLAKVTQVTDSKPYLDGSYTSMLPSVLAYYRFPYVVVNQVAAGALPADPNGIYIIFAPKETPHDGMCNSNCGIRSRDSFQYYTYLKNIPDNGLNDLRIVVFSIPTDSPECKAKCYAQLMRPANGFPLVESALNNLYGLLVDTITSPDYNGWFDKDKGTFPASACTKEFGNKVKLPDYPKRGFYNSFIGNRRYLLQGILKKDSNVCQFGV